jgi:hypothetical protein
MAKLGNHYGEMRNASGREPSCQPDSRKPTLPRQRLSSRNRVLWVARPRETPSRLRSGSAAVAIGRVELSRHLATPHLGVQSESVLFVYAENVERSKVRADVTQSCTPQGVRGLGHRSLGESRSRAAHTRLPSRHESRHEGQYSESRSAQVGRHEESRTSTRRRFTKR